MGSKYNTLKLGGFSRLPKELSAGEGLQVIIELDLGNFKIMDCSWNPCFPVVEDFLKKMMIGIHIENDFDTLLAAIEQRLILKSKRAFIAALRDLKRCYQEYQYGPMEQGTELSRTQADKIKDFSFGEKRETKIDPDIYFNR